MLEIIVRADYEMFIEMVKQGHEVTVLTQGDARLASNGFKKMA